MPILIDQLNVNAKVRGKPQPDQKKNEPSVAVESIPPAQVLALLERSLDAKRW